MPIFTGKLTFNLTRRLFLSHLMLSGVALQVSAKEAKFNELFLKSGGAPIELKYFEQGDSVQPGRYSVDIYLNLKLVKRQEITLRADPVTHRVTPIIQRSLLEEMGVDVSRLEKDGIVPAGAEDAWHVDLEKSVKGASVQFDVTRLALEISLPQVYVKRRASGAVDPTLWDEGLTAFYSDYRANFTRNQANGYRSDYRYIGLRNGLNVKGWGFRNESTMTGSSDSPTRFRSSRNYVERQLFGVKGTLSLGELYSGGEIFDSVRFRGAQLSSDLGMLSENEIGFAPIVRGIAETRATVEVWQNGYVIYSTSVSPGAFEINDLSPSGSNGDLTIKILETDGQVREYTQAYAYLPVMTRQGSFRYSLSTGEYAYEGQSSPKFSQGTMVYGLSNNLTTYGGALISPEYDAFNFGLGINSSLGGFSWDVTNSRSKSPTGHVNRGQSARMLYSKTLNQFGTHLTMVGYRYSTEGYRTFSQHVGDLEYFDGWSHGRQKHRIDLNINQSLGQRGSMFMTLGEASYWDGQGRQRNWQMGYSGSIANASYNIAVLRSESNDRRHQADTQFTASVSIPFGSRARAHRLYASAVASRYGDSSVQSSVSGYMDEQNTVSYFAQTGQSRQSGNSSGIGLGWETNRARLNGNYSRSYTSKHIDLNAAGSLVLHPDGLTFGQPLGETFALVEVPEVSGIGVEGFTTVRTDDKGYALVPYIQPYRYNWINLDTTTLDSDVEVTQNSTQVVPVRGAVVKARYASLQGRRVQFDLKLDNGERIPFGAQARDAQGEVVGMVDNLSRLLVFSTAEQGVMELQWRSGSCVAEYKLPPPQPSQAYQRLVVLCRSQPVR